MMYAVGERGRTSHLGFIRLFVEAQKRPRFQKARSRAQRLPLDSCVPAHGSLGIQVRELRVTFNRDAQARFWIRRNCSWSASSSFLNTAAMMMVGATPRQARLLSHATSLV